MKLRFRLIAMVFGFTAFLCWSVAYASEMDLMNQMEMRDSALRFFDENELYLQNACAKMLRSDIDRIEFHYSPDQSGSIEVWEGLGDEEILSSVDEYNDLLNVEPIQSEKDGRHSIFRLYREGDGIDIKLWDYYNPVDFLRVNQHGFYYVPCDCCKNASPEQKLEEHMAKEWDLKTRVEDEHEFIQVSEDFIYYHWLG